MAAASIDQSTTRQFDPSGYLTQTAGHELCSRYGPCLCWLPFVIQNSFLISCYFLHAFNFHTSLLRPSFAITSRLFPLKIRALYAFTSSPRRPTLCSRISLRNCCTQIASKPWQSGKETSPVPQRTTRALPQSSPLRNVQGALHAHVTAAG